MAIASTKESKPVTPRIVGDYEMSKLIRNFEWENTSLGPIAGWPQSLVTTVNIILQSPVPIVMLWGRDGIMLYNDAYSEFAGARHPALLGSKVVEGWPEVADFNRNVMKAGLAGKTLIYRDQTLTLYRHDKPEEVSMDLTYSPIIDESGKPGGVLAVVIETTKRIKAEKSQQAAEKMLRAERERLHAIFMQAPAPIAILHGPKHIFELTNPQYLRLVGRTTSLLGKPLAEAMPEVVAQGFIKILDDVYKSGKPFYGNEIPIDLVSEAGETSKHFLNFVYQPSFDSDGKVDGILVHAVDVTAQVLARKQVEEIANLNKTLTDNATTGLMVMDADHYCTFMNPAAEKITGYTLRQIQKTGKTLHDVVHYKRPDGSPYPIEECPTSRAVVTGKKTTSKSDDYFVRPDGSMYPVAIMSSPIMHEGEVVGIVEEIRDVSKEKETEGKILQLNKELENRVEARTKELRAANQELNRSNVELQDFAYVASHDLQEPLRKIAAFSNLLDEDFGDVLPEEAHAYLDGLLKSSARMRILIEDLLTYSRVTTQARPFIEIDLNRVVSEALDDLQARIDETGAVVTVDKLCKVQADALQIRLLLQNLLSNAMKYTRAGVKPLIRISAETIDGSCIISVRDNGIGFDEKFLDRIFTIFQRLHGKNEYEGTGVGLAIVKKIVDRHSGTITAKSKPGKGATFIVTLPLKQQRKA